MLSVGILDRARRPEELYEAHSEAILRRARRLLGDDDEARDVLHDLFLSVLGRPLRFEARSQLGTYLYSATTHACLNRIRNQRTRARLLAERASISAPGSASHAEDVAEVRELLARMPTELAQVLVCYYVDEMTRDDMARLLGCSRRRVGNLLVRAVAWMRNHLGQAAD
jgi:RNA polymerase sigma-70 factor (ECF subfamily)